jgi:vacuolar-type H+-ATPase subunit I/STV1
MNVKELFDKAENGTLNYEQFKQAVKDANAKFVDISDGSYVSKNKYEDDLKAKDTQIETLNGTISTRDTDLANIKKQLEEAGADADKLATLSNDLSTLQGKYDTDIKNYQEQLSRQAYEFAVREFANTEKFTSNAAKREFINSLINENLKMNDKNEIMGASDFVKMYKESNADSFVVEPTPTPEPTPKPVPSFVQPTNTPTPPAKPTLSELMLAKNNNPNMEINF